MGLCGERSDVEVSKEGRTVGDLLPESEEDSMVVIRQAARVAIAHEEPLTLVYGP